MPRIVGQAGDRELVHTYIRTYVHTYIHNCLFV